MITKSRIATIMPVKKGSLPMILSDLKFVNLFKCNLKILFYEIMTIRITIMLDEGIASKIRKKQARAVRKSNKSVSFSRIINEVLSECLKKG